MATLQFSVAVRNALLDAVETAIGGSPVIEMRTGALPANCAAASSGNLLSRDAIPADWMAAASGGTKAKAGTWTLTGLANIATSDIGHFRIFAAGSPDVCVAQGDVTATGGGGAMTVDNISLAAAQVFNGATAVAGRGVFVSGAKMLDGKLYCAYDIDAGAEKGFHRSTDAGVTWSASLSATFVEATVDQCMLFPAANTGDAADCLAIYHDASTDQLTMKMWDSSAAAALESAFTLGDVVVENTSDGIGQYLFSGTIRHSDGHLLVSLLSERDVTGFSHQFYDCNRTNTAFEATLKTSVVASGDAADDHYYPSVFIDQGTDDIYVAYTGKRDGSETLGTSAKVYYTKSTDGGATWSAGDTAYMEGAAAAVLQTWAPLMGPRFGVSWRTGTTLNFNKVNSLTFSAGDPERIADLAQTLDALTVASDADLAIAGNSTVTLGAATLSSAASVAVAADLSQTLGAVTLDAQGGAQQLTADLDQALAEVGLTAAATVAVVGDLGQTLGTVSVAADAASAITGTAAQTLGAITLAADADLGISAGTAQTLGEVALGATGAARITAEAPNTLSDVGLEGVAAAGIAAALSQTLGDITLTSAAGDFTLIADLAVALGDLALEADATVSQPAASAAPASGRRGGVLIKRGRRKPSFIGVPDQPLRVVPPVAANPIMASVNATLGDVQITAAASLGESPAARRRRRAAATLLLH